MKVSKDLFKGILIGVIITSFAFCSIFAAPVTKNIQVVFSGVKIALEGKILDLKDANGKKVEPLAYNGTTYLPVRALANAFGKEVTYDQKENTIYLGKVIKPNGMVVGAATVPFYSKNQMNVGLPWTEGKKLAIKGKEYQVVDSITCIGIGKNGSASIEYNLEQGYSNITGYFGVDDSSPNPTDPSTAHKTGANLQIIGDGTVLYESEVATKGGEPHKVDVNLTGVKKLIIKVLPIDSIPNYTFKYNFVDVKFTKCQ